MTENEVLIKTPEEAIETIKSNMPTSGYQMLRESLDMAIIALKEIQLYKDNKLCLVPEDVYSRQCSELDAYKEIGTVEEVRNQEHNLGVAYKIISDYEAIGTVEQVKNQKENLSVAYRIINDYESIGTVKECREAVEKLDKAEKALNILLSGNYNNECNFCVHNGNPMANCQCICGDGSWCIHNAKWNGKTSDDEDLEGIEENE